MSKPLVMMLSFVSLAGCQVAEEGELQGEPTTAALTTSYFYDLADYIAPSCTAPIDLAFAHAGTRRYVPMGVRDGRGRFVYVKSPDGKSFEEYTVDREWIRVWSDTSWAYENDTVAPPFCDEVCGTSGTPTACVREWANDPGAYAYQAPKDVDHPQLGAPFMPRYLARDNGPHAIAFRFYIDAYQRATCTACDNADSWHASPSVGNHVATGTAIFKHVDAYHGFSDLVVKVVTGGPGTGDRFWYARGFGFVGFQQLVPGSSDPTSTDPNVAPYSYDDFATGSAGAGNVLPTRGCFDFAQGETCSALPSGSPPLGATISIRAAANNQTVCADDLGNSPLIANRGGVGGDWEKFRVVDAGNGNVGLYAFANGKMVCADAGGQASLIANRGSIGGSWEVYRWIDLPTGGFALQSAANGKYVTAESAGAQPLIANRDSVGLWETFYFEVH